MPVATVTVTIDLFQRSSKEAKLKPNIVTDVHQYITYVRNDYLCLDHLQREKDDKEYYLGLYGCHPKPKVTQFFTLPHFTIFPTLLCPSSEPEMFFIITPLLLSTTSNSIVYTSRCGAAGLIRPISDYEILEWVVPRFLPTPSWNSSSPLSSRQNSTLIDAVVPVHLTRPGPRSWLDWLNVVVARRC
uniref:Uncharacterized protein n=1 Tax=Timema poppense TaxID=170557 RepID=A0A7R9H7P6_TIMPO|nr:unnamed protein product [Timema poppensis]